MSQPRITARRDLEGRGGGGWREPILALALAAPVIFAMLVARTRLDERSTDDESVSAGGSVAEAALLVQTAGEQASFAPLAPPVGSDSGASTEPDIDVPTETPTPSTTPTPSISPTPSITPTPTLTPPPTDTPTPGPESNLPIIPSIDEAMKARLRAIHVDGLSRGARPDVFAKIGDSITSSRFFLVDVGCGGARFDDTPEHVALAGIVERFRAAPVGTGDVTGPCGPQNSFTRRGFGAASGWTAARVLVPLGNEVTICPPPVDTPLRCEFETIKPSIALIMFGTNDLQQRIPPNAFRERLERIAADSIAAGVIPVLGTIPPRADAQWSAGLVGAYNGAIVEAAQAAGVPLWNSWRAMAEPAAVGRSMAPDGIHPSVAAGRPADFRGEAALGGL